MNRRTSTAWSVAIVLAAAGLTAHARDGWQVPPSSGRAELMRHHFESVTAIRDAVIRGDLSQARDEARMVAAMPDPVGLPPSGVAHLQALKTAAGRVAATTNLAGASNDTAAMLATCGDCHRAVGTMPAHPTPPEPKVGGVIGHMEQHRNAADLLSQGLTTPSTSLWNDGADALLTAPLASDRMPPKATITRDAMKREKDIHALATRARQATDRDSRVAIYGELIASCSACHAGNKNGYSR